MTASKSLSILAAVAVVPTGLFAAGYERSNIDTSFLYESGTYAEYGYGRVTPDIAGRDTAGNVQKENVAPSFTASTAAVKTSIGENLDIGVWYASSGNGVLIDWTGQLPVTADLSIPSLVGLVKYKFGDNFSIIGGLKRVTMNAGSSVSLPVIGVTTVGTYSLSSASVTTSVYGVAYERPDIALRVELLAEGDGDLAVPTSYQQAGAVPLSATSGVIDAGIGDAFTLKFQTGIAENTLLFGSVRNSKWQNDQSFVPFYNGSGFDKQQVSSFGDGNSYTLGIGRRFNDAVSISGSIYSDPGSSCESEPALAPTCGTKSVTVGSKINVAESANLSLGYTWSQRGDSTVTSSGAPIASTKSNVVTTIGAKLSFSF